ncbi:MAG TPA: DcaP family trimeric outer membrane transporter [Chthoniobacteraceae bacterium]|nr:DcaP family trimeric outer membrane transporter [Chthoniobacteraceae bacterium]
MKNPTLLTAFAVLFVAVAPSTSAEDSEIAELKAMVRAMQKTIAEQNTRIATLEKGQAAQTGKPSAKTATSGRSVSVAGMDVPVAELPAGAMPSGRSAVRDADTFLDQQQAAPRVNNVPLDPKLKGFIPIPGTDTMFKIGGSARVDAIVDLSNNGNPNQFVPSTIPVPGEPGWDGGERSTLHAKGTRLSFELRRPVPWDGTLRIYTEYDFFDDSPSSSMKFRARHFYGQAWNFLIGQTFTAFMDVDAFPDVVDYQGPNGIVNRRQPQIRYTLPIHEGATKFQLFASIEQPESKVDTTSAEFPDGGTNLTHTPDGVGGFRWEGSLGHMQASALFREVSFETDNGPSEDTFGWGLSYSAALNLFEKDKLSAQVTYGEGVARYINDLSGENLDAAVDGGRLEAIPVFAAMAGYTHHWNEEWRSTVSGGYVHVDAPASLDRFTIDNTVYGSVNLMWHPTTSFRMGLEYLYGRKETIDGSERDAHRFNFVVRYDLVR